MKRKFIILMLIVLLTKSFLLLLGCQSNHLVKQNASVSMADLREEYDLREECGKLAENWFKAYQQNFPGDKLAYRSHYNLKLDKCFIYTTSFQSGGYQTVILSDVDENKQYGVCVGTLDEEDDFVCDFMGKNVKGKKDWDVLVKSYMEN